MTHFASDGFHFEGGVGPEELEHINGLGTAPSDGHIFRVISRPSFLPNEKVTYRQYSTCFLHNIELYLANGWQDEGIEGINEKECIDWINSRQDCSYDAVLRNDPTLGVKPRKQEIPYRYAQAYEERSEMGRGKYCDT